MSFRSHVGFVCESIWLGIIQARRVQQTNWKQVDLQLSYSRDGRHWSRPHQRQPFIPLGDAESCEADYSAAPLAEPVLLGEELYFYYFGSRFFTRDKIPVSSFQPYVGLAKLRRDGFASLNADETPGQVVTCPLAFGGESLFVNAEVATHGWIKAAVLSRDSQPISEYALNDAVPLVKNTTKGRMAWKSKEELPPSRRRSFANRLPTQERQVVLVLDRIAANLHERTQHVKLRIVLVLLAGVLSAASAREYHVSPSGNDAQPGTRARPLRTVSAAARLAD